MGRHALSSNQDTGLSVSYSQSVRRGGTATIDRTSRPAQEWHARPGDEAGAGGHHGSHSAQHAPGGRRRRRRWFHLWPMRAAPAHGVIDLRDASDLASRPVPPCTDGGLVVGLNPQHERADALAMSRARAAATDYSVPPASAASAFVSGLARTLDIFPYIDRLAPSIDEQLASVFEEIRQVSRG